MVTEPTLSQSTAPNSAHDHAALGGALAAGGSFLIHGLAHAAATPFLVALLPQLATTTVILCEHEGDAQRLATQLRRTFPQRTVVRYPTHLHYAYETKTLDPEIVAQRLTAYAALVDTPGAVIIATQPCGTAAYRLAQDLARLSAAHHTR